MRSSSRGRRLMPRTGPGTSSGGKSSQRTSAVVTPRSASRTVRSSSCSATRTPTRGCCGSPVSRSSGPLQPDDRRASSGRAHFESRVQALLASLATHVEAWALEEPRALLDAGEWGMAFEALRYNLYEKDIPVFPGEVAEIESLGGGDEHPAPGLAADARASYRMVPRAHRLVAMRALDLFHDPRRRSYASMPEMDALTEPDALQEAALVDVRLSALDNSVGLLFDLRGALQLQDGDTAILIAREVTRMSWDALSR